MSRFPAPSPPVVGGDPKYHSGTSNHPVAHVVIHSAVIPCEPGRARQLGAWNRDGTTKGSWHYATDPKETIQCSFDRYVCHAAPPNGRKLHIEMCDWPAPVPASKPRQYWKAWRWAQANHRAMLKRTAVLTAELCLAYDLPPQFVGVKGMRAGKRGVTTHAVVTKTYGQSTHWDPGWWPRARFMKMVRAEVARLKKEAARG